MYIIDLYIYIYIVCDIFSMFQHTQVYTKFKRHMTSYEISTLVLFNLGVPPTHPTHSTICVLKKKVTWESCILIHMNPVI